MEEQNNMMEVPIKFLQFECEDCKIKTMINLEDDLNISELGDKVYCLKCGRQIAKRTRIFEMTINSYNDYNKVMEEYK